jgi:hypothetical protein
MRFVYHPKGCQWCMDYCAHAAQADLLQEESYLKAIRTRDIAIKEESFYRRKADAYLDELDVADRHIKWLEEQLARYERQLGLDREPQGRSAKRPRYESNEPESRHEPTPSSVNTDSHHSTPTSQAPPTFVQVAVAPAYTYEDVEMDDGNNSHFPHLPQPSALNPPSTSRSASWTLAQQPRSLPPPLMNTGGRPIRPAPLILRSGEDLARAMAQANKLDNQPALA